MRDVQAVFASEREVEVVAGDSRDLLRLEPEQPADAVVLVDDEVAGAQVRERLERSAQPRVRTGRPLAEDLDVRKEREPEVAPDEATTGRADDEAQRGILGEGRHFRDDLGVDLAEQPLRALGLAAVRERDEHAAALAQHPGELGLRLREPSCGNGRPLCLERMELRVRERVERGGVLEVQGLEALLLPQMPHVGGLPDEVGRAIERRNEIVRNSSLVIGEHRLEVVLAALGSRIDDRVLDGMQRALRERRERADLLDLVAEELDAKRVAAGARKDVHEPAAHRELASGVDSLGAFVPCERERFDEAVEAELVPDPNLDRDGPFVLGRKALCNRAGRRADETASSEHGEGPRALTDEVRRRIEPGVDTDAAARQECDVRWVDVPGDGLGGVPRLLLLGEQAEELQSERLVQGGEDKRERRLGHACRGGKGVRERAELLGLGELRDECVERGKRRVHTYGGNCVPCPHRSQGGKALKSPFLRASAL